MSLRDLLTPELYDEIVKEAKNHQESGNATEQKKLKVKCPICHQLTEYSPNNPYRPFCSKKCQYIDLGAWANNERALKGKAITEDDDGEMLTNPTLPKYHIKDE